MLKVLLICAQVDFGGDTNCNMARIPHPHPPLYSFWAKVKALPASPVVIILDKQPLDTESQLLSEFSLLSQNSWCSFSQCQNSIAVSASVRVPLLSQSVSEFHCSFSQCRDPWFCLQNKQNIKVRSF